VTVGVRIAIALGLVLVLAGVVVWARLGYL
jgi:hypothetical protein